MRKPSGLPSGNSRFGASPSCTMMRSRSTMIMEWPQASSVGVCKSIVSLPGGWGRSPLFSEKICDGLDDLVLARSRNATVKRKGDDLLSDPVGYGEFALPAGLEEREPMARLPVDSRLDPTSGKIGAQGVTNRSRNPDVVEKGRHIPEVGPGHDDVSDGGQVLVVVASRGAAG